MNATIQATAHRVYFIHNGPTDLGTVTETQKYLPNGAASPDGDLYVRVAFDDGYDNWVHHSFLVSVSGDDAEATTVKSGPECPDCGRPVSSLAWVSDEHHAKCPQRDPHF